MNTEKRKRYFVGIVISDFMGEEYCYSQILSTTDKQRGKNTILDIMHTNSILPEYAIISQKMFFKEYRKGLENFIGWHNIILNNNGNIEWKKKSQEEIDDIFSYNQLIPCDVDNEYYEECYEEDEYYEDDDGAWEETLRINEILIAQGDY